MRIEFGARDLENGTCVIARRDNREKETVKIEDLSKRCLELCEQIQKDMFERAKKVRDENIVSLTSWDGFIEALDAKKLIMTPWCNTKDSEELVKKKSTSESTGGAAKTLCIPFEQPALEAGTKCFITGRTRHVLGSLGSILLNNRRASARGRVRAWAHDVIQRMIFILSNF